MCRYHVEICSRKLREAGRVSGFVPASCGKPAKSSVLFPQVAALRHHVGIYSRKLRRLSRAHPNLSPIVLTGGAQVRRSSTFASLLSITVEFRRNSGMRGTPSPQAVATPCTGLSTLKTYGLFPFGLYGLFPYLLHYRASRNS
jgi:hypothetical protein